MTKRPHNKSGVFDFVDDSVSLLKSFVGSASRAFAPRLDPTGSAARKSASGPGYGTISEGMVIQTRVASFDCLCEVGAIQVACTMLSRISNCGFGAADASLPPEGSRVLIYQSHPGDAIGWILGVINMASYLSMNNQSVDIPARMNYEFEDLDAYWDNAAYNPIEGDEDAVVLWANDNRPKDVLPGDVAIKNENNCGYDISSYSMTVSGGNSFIRIDRIDDEIRLRSTNFTKWTTHQASKEFNDGGLISAEGRDYSYQGEWLGGMGRTGPHYEKPSETKDKEPRPRTRWWKGFLGNLFSWFAVRPRYSKDSEDTGLASIHVSQAGNVMARAAGGISLERYDEIPVPHRLKEEWDPEGDREVDVKHKPMFHFDLSSDPHAVGLLKSSQMAWEQKSAYQRFDELKKDFKVQQESEVKRPETGDEDPFGSQEANLSEYQGRKAGVFIGPDGSVIIRDAWGSEIVMEGGNVTINTPGNVITTANRNVVSIAGQTVAVRGAKGADVTADDGHVHIQSKKVVEIAGGSDESSGGVLIESLGEGPAVSAPEEAGDAALVSGVVIKSEKGGVSLSGKYAYVTGLDDVFITGGDNGSERNGSVFIDGENVIATGARTTGMVVKTSACLVTESGALLVSDEGSALVAGKSAMILNGDQVPVLWVSIDEAPDLSKIKDIWDALQTSDIIQPMDWQNLVKNAMFSFRKSSELKTDQGLSPWKPNGFKMYQPYWQVMKDLGVDTVVSTPSKLEVEAVHSSKCWPGKEAMDNGKFVTVSSGSLNVGGQCASSKSRESLKDSVSVEERSFSEFKV